MVSSLSLLSLFVTTTLLVVFPPAVSGSALTTTIAANERTCFYASVDKVGEKVSSIRSYYFDPSDER